MIGALTHCNLTLENFGSRYGKFTFVFFDDTKDGVAGFNFVQFDGGFFGESKNLFRVVDVEGDCFFLGVYGNDLSDDDRGFNQYGLVFDDGYLS